MALNYLEGTSSSQFQIGLKENKNILLASQYGLSLDKKLFVDEIAEKTTDNGVLIENVLIKDGNVDGVDVSVLNTSVSSHTGASTGVHGVTGSVVGTTDSQTLTNKSIDADNNTISNLELDNFKSGVIDTDTSLTANSDSKLATQKAVKAYVDNSISASNSSSTTSDTYTIDSDGGAPIKLKNNSGALELRNDAGTDYVDLRVKNLTVEGTTTTINSETLTINDNVIVLNNNVTSGTPTETGGIQVRRGDQPNASLIFHETWGMWLAGKAGQERELLDVSTTQSMVNKGINANNNTITNLTTATLKSGVLLTDLSSMPSDDTTLASAKATKTAINSAISGLASDQGLAKWIKLSVGTSNVSSTTSIPLNAEILQVRVKVATPYTNGTTLSVGRGSQELMADSMVDVGTADTYIKDSSDVITTSGVVTVTLGNSPSAGASTVYIQYIDSSKFLG